MTSGSRLRTKIKYGIEREFDDDNLSKVLARAEATKADAAKARDRAVRAHGDAEAVAARANRAFDDAVRSLKRRIAVEKARTNGSAAHASLVDLAAPSGARNILIKALGILGQIAERAATALVSKKRRLEMGTTWNELIVNDQHEKHVVGQDRFDDDHDDDDDEFDEEEDADLDDDE